MLAQSVSSILASKVTLELESIDRLYLNAYVPRLQTTLGFVGFVHEQLGMPIASTQAVASMSREFVKAIEDFAKAQDVELIRFKKGERKEDIAQQYLSRFEGDEGVVFIGKAQEKISTFRTSKRRNPETGQTYPWIIRSTAVVNQYYFYILDKDFGLLFIKFSSYFPYTAKVCLNGHEWLKRQLARRGIEAEALDNGILRCADPKQMQRLADRLDSKRIDAVFRKWLKRLPHPFRPRHRLAGYRYDLSILQAEFALTQVFDRPQTGRIFFEEVIRENLDLGRPDRVQLIFKRRVTRRTPGSFRTRVLTQGVIPSLHIDYKCNKIKQYHKEGRALRTETTINNARDFGIGKRLHNLPALREIGFQANRRLLDVQSISHDCTIGHHHFESVIQPALVKGQRASALKFGDPRTMLLMLALTLFRILPRGFQNRDLRELIAPLLDEPAQIKPGRMSYDLRRLRLHGLIERIPKTHRYRVTDQGFRVAMFFSRSYSRLLRPELSIEALESRFVSEHGKELPPTFCKLLQAADKFLEETRLSA